MKDIELKPCPFCGGEAKLMYHYPTFGRRRQSVVNCTRCRGNSGRWGRSDKAIEAWNRRKKDEQSD